MSVTPTTKKARKPMRLQAEDLPLAPTKANTKQNTPKARLPRIFLFKPTD